MIFSAVLGRKYCLLWPGQWQPVGRFVTAGNSPSTDPFVEKYARAFSGKVEEVKQACICLGGKQRERLAGADVTFEMPVLPDFSVLLQFWDGDEEFLPKILLLWDKVSLSYLHFETTYYLQGDLLKAILQTIGWIHFSRSFGGDIHETNITGCSSSYQTAPFL